MNLSKYGFYKENYLIIAIFLFTVLRIPSIFEGFWYADEGMHAALATNLANGQLLYNGAWDHKPPLMALIYSLAYPFGWIIGLQILKILSIFVGWLSIFQLYKLIKTHFPTKYLFFVLIIFASLLGSPIIEGNTVNAEIFFLPLSIYSISLIIGKGGFARLGLIAGVAFLLKPQIFIEILFLVLIKFIKEKSKSSLRFFITFLAVLIPFIIYLLVNNLFGAAFDAIFIQNGKYIDPLDKDLTLISNLIKLLTLITLTVFNFFHYRNPILDFKWYLVINVFIVEYLMVITSGRVYIHYLIQLLPGFVLISLILFTKYRQSIYKGIFLLLALTIFILLSFTKDLSKFGLTFYLRPNLYYGYFITDVIAGQPSDYRFWFKSELSIEKLALANFIDSNFGGSKVFIFTEDSWIQALSKEVEFTNKYLVWYHMKLDTDKQNQSLKDLSNADILMIEGQARHEFENLFTNIEPNYRMIDQKYGYLIFQKY